METFLDRIYISPFVYVLDNWCSLNDKRLKKEICKHFNLNNDEIELLFDGHKIPVLIPEDNPFDGIEVNDHTCYFLKLEKDVDSKLNRVILIKEPVGNSGSFDDINSYNIDNIIKHPTPSWYKYSNLFMTLTNLSLKALLLASIYKTYC